MAQLLQQIGNTGASATFGVGTSSRSVILVAAGFRKIGIGAGQVALPTISDDKGNSYVILSSARQSTTLTGATRLGCIVFACFNPAAGTKTVTLAIAGTNSVVFATSIFEFVGPLSIDNGLVLSGTNSFPPGSNAAGTVNLSTPSDLVFFVIYGLSATTVLGVIPSSMNPVDSILDGTSHFLTAWGEPSYSGSITAGFATQAINAVGFIALAGLTQLFKNHTVDTLVQSDAQSLHSIDALIIVGLIPQPTHQVDCSIAGILIRSIAKVFGVTTTAGRPFTVND